MVHTHATQTPRTRRAHTRARIHTWHTHAARTHAHTHARMDARMHPRFHEYSRWANGRDHTAHVREGTSRQIAAREIHPNHGYPSLGEPSCHRVKCSALTSFQHPSTWFMCLIARHPCQPRGVSIQRRRGRTTPLLSFCVVPRRARLRCVPSARLCAPQGDRMQLPIAVQACCPQTADTLLICCLGVCHSRSLRLCCWTKERLRTLLRSLASTRCAWWQRPRFLGEQAQQLPFMTQFRRACQL